MILNNMEVSTFFDVEKEIDRISRSEFITESLCEAVFHVLTPREASMLLGLYDGKTMLEMATEWEISERAVYAIKASMVEKLEPFLMERGILKSPSGEHGNDVQEGDMGGKLGEDVL